MNQLKFVMAAGLAIASSIVLWAILAVLCIGLMNIFLGLI